MCQSQLQSCRWGHQNPIPETPYPIPHTPAQTTGPEPNRLRPLPLPVYISLPYSSDCRLFRFRLSTFSTTFSTSVRKKLFACCGTATCVPGWPSAEAISFQR
jgi:hypothetical protein